jgi:hypothetical protein
LNFFGTFTAVTAFGFFYLMTVFTLSWATTDLGYSKETFIDAVVAGLFCHLFRFFDCRQNRAPKTLVYVTIAIGFLFSFLIF